MSKKLEFGNKMKLWLIVPMVLGVIAMIYTFFWNHGFNQHARFWSNLLLNTYYFAGIAVTGVFFITAHHLGYSGWQTVLKKIPMAMGKFLYIALFLMIIITLGIFFDWHNLYAHWSSVHGMEDLIVKEKRKFLNPTFFAIIVIGFYFLWAFFARLMYTKFMSIANLKEYKNTKAIAAIFLLVFGVSSSVLSWMVVMSIDPHWYSTLFGWYNLMSYFAAGMSLMALIVIFLKSRGMLEHVDENHVHDIAKYMFGFSVFWTYLWFSQFMLIWYANIPEATIWFQKRFDLPLFKFILIFNLFINFVAPFLLILKRSAKRNFKLVSFVAVLLLIGHYLDFYGMIMLEPMNVYAHHDEAHHADNSSSTALFAEHDGEEHHEATEAHSEETHSDHQEHAADKVDHHQADAHAADAHDAHGVDAAHGEGHGHKEGHGHADAHDAKNLAVIGLPEILIFLGFMGLFLFVVFSTLNDTELEVTEDPFLKESLHHHFDY